MKKSLNFLLIACIPLFNSCKKSDSDSSKIINYPSEGMVSYFNFDNNLKDNKGNTSDGVNHGAVFVSGKVGQAISFDGVTQYVQFNKKTFRSGNNISVAFWFKKKANDNMYFLVCADFGVGFYYDKVNQVNKAFLAISLPSTNSAYGNYTLDVCTHIVGTYDGTYIKTYINGILQNTVKHAGIISDMDNNLTIGLFGDSYVSGIIDELLIYNRTITQADVNQIYTAY